MRLAIAGKGGVGKTTLASLLAMVYSAEGKRVIAIDADPDANLAGALGIPPEQARRITPISQLKDLIEERTGAKAGSFGAYLKLNPRVDDIPDRFSAHKGNIRLMVLGTVKGGGAGCICPESALLRSLMSHLLLERSEVIIMDMEAGLEHLARGTAAGVDAFIIVVEPGRRSLQTAESIQKLAKDLGIDKCYVVGCKTQNAADRLFITENMPGFEIIGFINYNAAIVQADRQGTGIYEAAPEAVLEARQIKERLEQGLSPKA
ncbi:MAG: carbon monoxide dehydrogenase [Chloroflexi bacterium RBG_13_53_26]|jgi:CO dehydrogenase maturation factor|nr:MAG: carbon monoxide dehydrogenase [Chloroflexi bacterium RBG_13_53_26]